jgi:putative SOS response-associated peptidase YedK
VVAEQFAVFDMPPYPSQSMAVQPVGTRVNRPGNDDPRCIEPI